MIEAYCELRELGLSNADKSRLLTDVRQHSIEVVQPYRAHLWLDGKEALEDESNTGQAFSLSSSNITC
jgi:hypothetical protein